MAPLGSLILLSMILAVVILTTRQIVYPMLLKEHNERIQDMGDRVVTKIGSMLSRTETLALSISYTAMNLIPDIKAIANAVPSILDIEDFRSIVAGGGVWPEPYVFDPEKELFSMFWGRNLQGKLIFYDNYNQPQGPGYHHEEWYVPARYLPKDHAYWSRASVDPYSHQSMITCTAPMWRGSDFLGAATVDLKLGGLRKMFQHASKDMNGYIFAVDRNNRFIVFPKRALVAIPDKDNTGSNAIKIMTATQLGEKAPEFRPIADSLEEINWDIVRLARTEPGYDSDIVSKIASESYQIDIDDAQLITAIMTDPFRRITRTSNCLKTLHLKNDVILHSPAIAAIFHTPGTYWKIVVVVPEKTMFGAVSQITNRIMLWLMGLITLIFLMACLIRQRYLIRPLRTMTQQLKKMDQDSHDLGMELDVPDVRELGELARCFNKRTEALRNSEEKYRTIFNRAGEGISMSDIDGNFIAVNPKFAEIFGYDSPDELVSTIKTMDIYVNLEDRKRIMKELRHGRGQVQTEIWAKKKDGSKILVKLNIGAVRDRDGNIKYLVAMLKDITRSRQIEEELRHAQKMEVVGTIAGDIAHEFNNILTAISGYNELAQMKAAGDPVLAEYHSQIAVAARRAKDLVQQILAFSRDRERDTHPLDISIIVNKALKLLRSTIPASIEIVKDIHPTGKVMADPTGIHQVVMNLCTNACRAMEPGPGTLEVRLHEFAPDSMLAARKNIQQRTYALIEVRDTGPGVKEDKGLDLAMVHEIVQACNGHMEMENRRGEGSVSSVYLPVIDELGQDRISDVRTGQPADVHMGNGEHVMFVDDEEMIATLSGFLLEDAGYRVQVFQDSRAALNRLKQDPESWDAIITDMTTPGIKGEQLIAEAKRLNPSIVTILYTGYSEVLSTEKMTRAKPDAFLQKPVPREELLRVLGDLIKGRKRQ